MKATIPTGRPNPSRSPDFFGFLKRRFPQEKNSMASFNDIERLRARTQRLCRVVSPPELQLWVGDEEGERPREKPWQLSIVIEAKGAHS